LNNQPVYLDYNATAPARREVIDIMVEVMSVPGNASSVHGTGRVARKRVEDARAEVARLVGAKPENVIFTSGGTEADNLALKGFGDRRLIVSAIEHGAILAPALLFDAGAEIVPVDKDGVVDLAALEDLLSQADKPVTVSIMLANNETGVIQSMRDIVQIAGRYNALVHTDAVQCAGKIPIDIEELGVDMLSLSAHKIGGPQGVGALVLREDRPLSSQIVGGGQERGRRSGTENVAGIAGFGVAARLALEGLEDYARLADLRDDMELQIKQIAPGCLIYSRDVPRLPNTSCLTMPGVKSETQVMSFDLAGIAISAGSACSSGKVTASHVLEAMESPDEVAVTAIRVSMGRDTTAADVDRFVETWRDIYRRCGTDADAA
jgi:cysteine desulfurase